jgi:anti-anti-sigma factor
MKVDTVSCGAVSILMPRGALITDEVPDFQGEVQSASQAMGGRVVIDMSGIPYLDSAGIQAVLSLYTEPNRTPFRPKLASLTETCRDALDLTNLISRLEVFDTVENAVRSYNP